MPLGEKFPDLRLLLVGGGEELDNLKKLVSKNQMDDRIFLTGQKPSHEIPYYINAADVCLASYVEKPGLSPFKVFEYMACGKPVICNAVGGVDALFDEHKVGKLVMSQDPDDWADCIEEMLSNPEQMAQYGENGLAAVHNEFNWEYICKKIENALEPLVSSR
jgi:glycosyltransferase involved in cell wall biosynthesis